MFQLFDELGCYLHISRQANTVRIDSATTEGVCYGRNASLISCRCELGGAIAIVVMSVRNRCHLNLFCDNLPTALGAGPLPAR